MSTFKVGILHSLHGTMAKSEKPLVDASLLAIDEINSTGGILGNRIEPVIEDGASDPAIFTEKANKLIQKDNITTIFGCWTSFARKAIKPIIEKSNSLLWYPVQYEGLESSKNIIYTGSCLNQQIYPAVRWLIKNQKKRFFLIGSNYVFPRTANKFIKAELKQQNCQVLAEEYKPLGTNDFTDIISQIKEVQPDVIFNTLNGDSNFYFYKQFHKAGISYKETPIMAVSIAEGELQEMKEAAQGHYACWSYFQSLEIPENEHFVSNFKKKYGSNKVTSDPIAAAYTQLYLWKGAVETARSFNISELCQNIVGQTFNSPGGEIRIEPNNHVTKNAHVGHISNGQFEIIWSSENKIKPLPWFGLEELDFRHSKLAIDLLSEVPEGIQYSWILEQKTRALEKSEEQLKNDITERKRVEESLLESLSLTQAIVESTVDGILVVNRNGKITSFNKRFQKIWRIPENILTERDDDKAIEFVLGQLKDPDVFLRKVRELYYKPDDTSFDTLEFIDGRIIERYSQAQRIDNKVVGRVWNFRDVTERKKAEEKLKLSAEVYERTIEGVVVTDKDAVIQYANPAACRISGYDAEELIGQKPSIWKSALHDEDFYKSMWKSLLEEDGWNGEIWNRRKDGTSFPVDTSISAIKDYSGKTTQYAAIYYDLTSIKQSEKKIQYLALHDALTGLANRTLFQDRLLQAIKKARRNKGKFAILFIDLDNFKHINDTMGHPTGDKLLQELSKRLLTCGRKEDTVSRLGGDEFALILDGIEFEEEAGTVARRVIEVFSGPYEIEDKAINTTVSIGIAIYPLNGKSVEELLKNADLAMYHVKDIGKNHFHYFTESLHEKAQKRMEVESGLKNAIKNDEISAYFQQKVDLKTGKTVAMEALARWIKPDGAVVSPADFIPIAEDTGQIVDIDRLILQKACSFFKQLKSDKQQLKSISVNLSAVDLSSSGLKVWLLKTVDSFGIDPGNIEFEVTESLVIKDIESTIKLLKSLRDEGFGISIDDFGTGHSSLSYLTKLPLPP